MTDKIGLWNFVPYTWYVQLSAQIMCYVFDHKICSWAFEHFADGDLSVDDLSRYVMVLSNLPSGSSYRQLMHYG